MSEKPQTIDEYIGEFPEDIRKILTDIRKLIGETVPGAKEKISYQMPTFELNGKNLIHFAAFKQHIGIYPTPSGVEAFRKELAPYKKAKGSIRFPLDKPIPMALIKQIVQFRVNEENAKLKNKK